MPNFTVSYETRQQGASGNFETHRRTVTADTPQAALEAVFTQLHKEGYETRFPNWVADENDKRVL